MNRRAVHVAPKANHFGRVADFAQDLLNHRTAPRLLPRIAPADHNDAGLGRDTADPFIVVGQVHHLSLGQVLGIGSPDRHHIELVVGPNAPMLPRTATHPFYGSVGVFFGRARGVHADATGVVVDIPPVPEKRETVSAIGVEHRALGHQRVNKV